MFKVKPLEKVLQTHPDFKPNWKNDLYGGLENPKFGKLTHIVVCKEDGTPIFDQYMIEEKPGAVIVPYDKHKGTIRVGMITEERFIPGKRYVALPRGFGKDNESELEAAYRELFEETGLSNGNLEDKAILVLGRNNPNTAFYKTDFPIVAAKFSRLEEIMNPKGDKFVEKIQKVRPYSFSEIRELEKTGQLECGITKAALFEFGCYMPEFYKG